MSNHFEVFGLTPAVDVDVKALEALFRERSLATHPDRLVGADPAERRRAAELSASMNEAMKVLRDPARRAFYLLKLRGVDLESEHAAAQVALPMDFLEEVMVLREALEEAKARQDVPAVTKLAEQVKGEARAALEAAQGALRGAALEVATVALARLRYYTRFLEEVDAFEEALVS